MLSWSGKSILKNPLKYGNCKYYNINIDGIIQDCRIPVANVLEILRSCTKSSISWRLYFCLRYHMSSCIIAVWQIIVEYNVKHEVCRIPKWPVGGVICNNVIHIYIYICIYCYRLLPQLVCVCVCVYNIKWASFFQTLFGQTCVDYLWPWSLCAFLCCFFVFCWIKYHNEM